MQGAGFEPANALSEQLTHTGKSKHLTDLEAVPFDHSGIPAESRKVSLRPYIKIDEIVFTIPQLFSRPFIPILIPTSFLVDGLGMSPCHAILRAVTIINPLCSLFFYAN